MCQCLQHNILPKTDVCIIDSRRIEILQVGLNFKIRKTSTSDYHQSRDRRRPRPRSFPLGTSDAANGGAYAFKSCYPVVLYDKSPSLLCGGRNKRHKTITRINNSNVVQHCVQRRKGGLVQRWWAWIWSRPSKRRDFLLRLQKVRSLLSVGCSGVVLFALLGIVGRHDGGRRCVFPSSLWFKRVLLCWMGCNGKTQTLFAVRPVIETISNLWLPP